MGGSNSVLQMNAFSILVVLIKKNPKSVSLFVRACAYVCIKGGGRSPGGSGGVSVTQSGCDHCQAPEK